MSEAAREEMRRAQVRYALEQQFMGLERLPVEPSDGYAEWLRDEYVAGRLDIDQLDTELGLAFAGGEASGTYDRWRRAAASRDKRM